MDKPSGPTLFKTTGFNRYGYGVWKHRPPPPITARKDDYSEMATAGGVEGDEIERFAFLGEDLVGEQSWPDRYTVRGAVHPRRPTPLPLREGARILTGVEADVVSYNPLGTVRLENPDRGVVDFVVTGGGGNLEEAEGLPDHNLDLHVPIEEAPGMARVCQELGLEGMSAEDKVNALQLYFSEEDFHYSLKLKPEVEGGRGSETAITRFLEVSRKGHCEYYATAATLLLRQAGVPARYCEGFGAQFGPDGWDADRGELLLRGIHAHAWCRAYIGGRPEERAGEDGVVETVWSGGKWVDVDFTPADWLRRERLGAGTPVLANLIDWWQRLREDFLIWRTRPANRLMVTVVMGIIAVLLFSYIAVRLWKQRTRGVRRGKVVPGGSEVRLTPLHQLERSAASVLGPRPAGTSLTRWLMGLDDLLPSLRAELRRAVALHWKARFDPLGAEKAEQLELESSCRELRKEIKRLKRA
jgi:hypothetical protein